MAMYTDFFIKSFSEMILHLATDEVVMLLGVPDEINRLHRRLDRIRDVLADAEERRLQDRAVSRWLRELRDVMYDAEDIIDECRIKADEIRRSGQPSTIRTGCFNRSCFRQVKFRHEIGNRIERLNQVLAELSKDKDDLHLSPSIRDSSLLVQGRISRRKSSVAEPNLVGEKVFEDTRLLVDLLLKQKTREKAYQIVAIVGMGGIGKTTLAQIIFNDEKLKAGFVDVPPIWVCVSQNFIEVELLRDIITRAGADPGDVRTKEDLEPILMHLVTGKRFFLVLDDVWYPQVWENLLRIPLQGCLMGSKILLTTRDDAVARQIGAEYIHKVDKLSDDQGWCLISKIVFDDEDDDNKKMLRDTGMSIVKKCDGLPLALRVIGGLLKTKEKRPVEWDKVFNSTAWSSSSIEQLPEGVMATLYLSYQDLPSHLKQCFIYLSLVFTGYNRVSKIDFVDLCIAEGIVKPQGIGTGLLLEDQAEGYWEELIRRNILQPDPLCYQERFCSMQNLMVSLSRRLASIESFSGDKKELDTRFATSSSSSSSSMIKLRRISIFDDLGLETLPGAVSEQTSLRSLRLSDLPSLKSLPMDLFEKITSLRLLGICSTSIEYLPNVANLIHLRYLNLTGSMISELPKSIGKLKTLQILVLRKCQNLHSLPSEITQLINLRHLDITETTIDRMPIGLGSLKELATLHGFMVNYYPDYSCHCDRSSNLEELSSLSGLRSLHLNYLVRVANIYEARAAQLIAMPHLRELSLDFTPEENRVPADVDIVERKIEKIEQVFQELCPPPSLEFLNISGYYGRMHPSWLSSPLLFPNLRYLELYNYYICEQLPTLGLLPQLDKIDIRSAFQVKRISRQFLLAPNASPDVCSPTSLPSFPKLIELTFQNLPSWEDWHWLRRNEDLPTLLPFPCLKVLVLEDCPKLRALPIRLLRHAPCLRKLVIGGSHNISQIRNLPAIQELELDHNQNLMRVSDLPSLKHLSVRRCNKLRFVTHVDALEVLLLADMEPDNHFLEWLVGGNGGGRGQVQRFPSLKKLSINDCIHL